MTRSYTLQNDYYNTTIALAGMVQAVSLIRELAQTGKAEEAAFQASIYSIFQTDPKSVTTVYGNLTGLKVGLETLVNILNNPAKQSRTLMRYLISIIHIQNKVRRSPKIIKKLEQRINQTKKQVDYFSLTHPTVIANLADTYLDTISTFRFRIMIWGNARILNSSDAMEKIRALLLAGIRSAVLWRQVGGSRLQLLFSRKKIKTMAENILTQLKQHEINEKERS